MIIIKTFEEIYKSLVQNFYNRTKIDVESRSVIDMIFKAISDAIHTVYETIEKNKKPYLFTDQKGDELDKTGYFLNCPRLNSESDGNYLYRLSNWIQRNATCNRTSIEDKCKELVYSSAASYAPYTHGLGTATIFLIPLEYTENGIKNAVAEAKDKIAKVLSPTSIVYFQVAEPSYIKLVSYLDVKEGYDLTTTKHAIKIAVQTYVNSIPPGEKLLLGDINKLGLSVTGVEYFSVIQLFNNNEEIANFELLQTIQAKFLLDEIIWWEVED